MNSSVQVIKVIFLYFIIDKLSLYVFGSTTDLFNEILLMVKVLLVSKF